MERLGRINNDLNDLKSSTCGLGLFISNLLSNIIEQSKSEKKKGLKVYSELGTGSCFVFYMKNTMKQERERLNLKCSSSDFVKTKDFFISSLEDNIRKYRFSSNEEFDNSSIEIKEKNNVQGENLTSRSNENLSCNSIPLKIHDFEIKKMPVNCLSRNFETLSSFGIAIDINNTLNPSIQSKINKIICKCTKILIVDDVAFNVEVCRKLLKKLNFESDSAFNGLEAVERISKLIESKKKIFCESCKFYRIILMDIDMPIKNGIDATKEILEILRSVNLEISIIGLSAFDQEIIKKRALDAGMNDYITKPITFKKLNDIIIKYI